LQKKYLMDRRLRLLSLLLLPLLGWGCGQRIGAPRLNVSSISERALNEYDTNKDGFLDTKELERCPGLKSCLTRFDHDKDGRLSKTELEEGLAEFTVSGAGLTEVLCKVTFDGKPLAGASVTLEPEAFMGDSIKSAKGTTDEQGTARMQADGSSVPGCNLGIYRVRISLTNDKGQEGLPARYNTETQLGIEVGSAKKGRGAYPFHLTRGR